MSRHVSSKHNISFVDYANKYYKEDKKIESCGNCKNDSEFIYRFNEENNTYSRDYRNRYVCNTQECKNDLSLKILKTPYNSKTYEHIGSHPNYLSIIRKISLEDAKNITLPNKHDSGDGVPESHRTSLKGYIIRYGKELGTIKYKERNIKIGKANTLDWHIERYGYNKGKIKYENYLAKLRKVTTGTRTSKASLKLKTIFDKHDIKYSEEHPVHVENKKRPKIVDYYLIDYNICIEFYGEYWHCNPKVYDNKYYHKLKKKYATEIWNDDNIRNKQIIKTTNGPLFIIWENEIPDDEIIINIINNIKTNNIVYL